MAVAENSFVSGYFHPSREINCLLFENENIMALYVAGRRQLIKLIHAYVISLIKWLVVKINFRPSSIYYSVCAIFLSEPLFFGYRNR